MGDYTKLIINCSIKELPNEKLEEFEEEFRSNCYVGTSAYHCGGDLLKIQNNGYSRTDITFVTQTKNGKYQKDLLDWLKPQITDGCGEDGAWAMSWTEYQREPTILYLNNWNKDDSTAN